MYHFMSTACAAWTDSNFTINPDGSPPYSFSVGIPGYVESYCCDSRTKRDKVISLGNAPIEMRKGKYRKNSCIHNRTQDLEFWIRFSSSLPPLPGPISSEYPTPSWEGTSIGYAKGIHNTFAWGLRHDDEGHLAQVIMRRDNGSFRQIIALAIIDGRPCQYHLYDRSGNWPSVNLAIQGLFSSSSFPAHPWSEILYEHPTSRDIKRFDEMIGILLGRAQTTHWDDLDYSLRSALFDRVLEGFTGPNPSWLETLIPLGSLPKDLSNLAKIPRNAKDLAELFLGIKYGIITIPGDIRDIFIAIRNTFVNLFVDRGIERHNARINFTDRSGWSGYANACVTAAIADRTSLWLSGTGLDDIATEIWNMIPFSFVVDWFLGIGDYFSELENSSRWKSLTLREISYSYKSSCSGEVLSTFFPDNIRCTGSYTVYTRIYLAGLPPTNAFQLPDISENFRKHWVEGVALIVQSLS